MDKEERKCKIETNNQKIEQTFSHNNRFFYLLSVSAIENTY